MIALRPRQAGLSVVGVILMIPGAVALALLIGLLGIFGIILGGLLIVMGAVVAAALSGVYQTALCE